MFLSHRHKEYLTAIRDGFSLAKGILPNKYSQPDSCRSLSYEKRLKFEQAIKEIAFPNADKLDVNKLELRELFEFSAVFKFCDQSLSAMGEMPDTSVRQIFSKKREQVDARLLQMCEMK